MALTNFKVNVSAKTTIPKTFQMALIFIYATIFHAPSSTMNKEGKRDPKMHHTKKENQYFFGRADLLEVSGGRGVPPRHSRRTLLEACWYVVHTGCSWRMLPREFPHWDNVYKTFRRWSAQGKFEQMHDRLRAQWRERMDRDESLSSIPSQLVALPKVAKVGMTPAKRQTAMY